jgi:hypothetical protein
MTGERAVVNNDNSSTELEAGASVVMLVKILIEV